MSRHSPIPQTIIDEIVGHLRDDPWTLKMCSTVSRPFSTPSQRHLFSAVHLYSTTVVQRLQLLLEKRPEVTSFIQTIHIYPDPTDVALPLILPKFTRVRKIVISHLVWNNLSTSSKTAIDTLLESNPVQTVHLVSVIDIPVSFIQSLNKVKTLVVDFVKLRSPHDLEEASLPKLKSLQFSRQVELDRWPVLSAQNLHQLSFEGGCKSPLMSSVGLKRLMENTESVENFVWHNYGDPALANIDPALCIGVLPRLRRLSFVTAHYERLTAPGADAMWRSLVRVVQEHPALHGLEEFVLAIKAGWNVPDGALFGADDPWWRELDALLADPARCPVLRRCSIYFDIAGCNAFTDQGAFRENVGRKLARLEARTVLRAAIVQDFDWRVLL